MTSTEPFLDLNAQQRLVKLHPNVHKLRPGVVRRTHPEAEPPSPPAPDPAPPAPPAPEAAEVAGKKKKPRAKVSAETRAVAVARVAKLIDAGTKAQKATATVAKELGVSESAVMNWRSAAKKAPKPRKQSGRRVEIAQHVRAPSEPAKLPLLPQAGLRMFVQKVARETIREEVRLYLNECFGISGAET